jgi:pilus assembly protein CpaE
MKIRENQAKDNINLTVSARIWKNNMMEDSPRLPVWQPTRSEIQIDVFVSEAALADCDLHAFRAAGFEPRVSTISPVEPVPELPRHTRALILEVQNGSPSGTERLEAILKRRPDLPVIVATRDLSVGAVRDLMRAGATDVLPLPLNEPEVLAAMERLREDLARHSDQSSSRGQVFAVVGSLGGSGATAVLTQLGALLASEKTREVCLLDFDIQFGNAALYLGSLPQLGMKDLIEAGARVDGSLLRSVIATHKSGLNYVAAPNEVMPLESISSDQALSIIDTAAAEYGTVLLDLPASWTNWSLSALARCKTIYILVELTLGSLHQARRQLDLIAQQGLSDLPIQIIANRVQKKLFRSIDLSDVEKALGRSVAFSIADDPDTVQMALDQGELVSSLNARSRAARDLGKLASAVPVEVL